MVTLEEAAPVDAHLEGLVAAAHRARVVHLGACHVDEAVELRAELEDGLAIRTQREGGGRRRRHRLHHVAHSVPEAEGHDRVAV